MICCNSGTYDGVIRWVGVYFLGLTSLMKVWGIPLLRLPPPKSPKSEPRPFPAIAIRALFASSKLAGCSNANRLANECINVITKPIGRCEKTKNRRCLVFEIDYFKSIKIQLFCRIINLLATYQFKEHPLWFEKRKNFWTPCGPLRIKRTWI